MAAIELTLPVRHEDAPFLSPAHRHAGRADRRLGPARGPGLYRGPAQPVAAVDHPADRPDRAAAIPQPAAPAADGEDAGGLRVPARSNGKGPSRRRIASTVAGRRPIAAGCRSDASTGLSGCGSWGGPRPALH